MPILTRRFQSRFKLQLPIHITHVHSSLSYQQTTYQKYDRRSHESPSGYGPLNISEHVMVCPYPGTPVFTSKWQRNTQAPPHEIAALFASLLRCTSSTYLSQYVYPAPRGWLSRLVCSADPRGTNETAQTRMASSSSSFWCPLL